MICKTDISKSIHNPALILVPFNVIAGSSARITVDSDFKDKITALWIRVTNTDDNALDISFEKDDKGLWTGGIPAEHLEHYGHVKGGVVIYATIDGVEYKCGIGDLNVIPDNPDAQAGEGTYHQLKIQLNSIITEVNAVSSKVDGIQDVVDEVKAETDEISGKVEVIEADIDVLEADIDGIEADVETIKQDVSKKIDNPEIKSENQVLTYDGSKWVATTPETVEDVKSIVNDLDRKTRRVIVDDKGFVTVQQYLSDGYYGTVDEQGDWFFAIERFEITEDDGDKFIDFYGRIQDLTNNGKIEEFSVGFNYVEDKAVYIPDEFKYNDRYVNVSFHKLTEAKWTDLYRLIQDNDKNIATKLSELEDDIGVVKFAYGTNHIINLYTDVSTGQINLGNGSKVDAKTISLLENNSMVNVGGSNDGVVKIGPNLILTGSAEKGKSNIWVDGEYLIIRTPTGTVQGQTLQAVEIPDGEHQGEIEWTAVDFPFEPTYVSQLENDTGYITQEAVPTNVSQLENDTGFVTETDLPTVQMTAELEDGSTVTFNLFGTEQ